MKMTLGTLLEEGKEKLEKAGVPDPLLDARFLLLDVFDMNFASFLVKRDRPLTETENGTNVTEADTDTRKKIDKYRELISKREMRIPLQQLTGVQEFMGLEFQVNEHVLIPRQDTETLVELVLSEHKEKNISLLDVCTGSGCIAISLAKLGGYTDVTALDLSEEALKVARSNGEKLLDQLTVDEMANMIAMAGYQTAAMDSVGKVATLDFQSGDRGTGAGGKRS